MPTEKKLTGYPSIDKPWLKYYKEKDVAFDINKTIYDNFKVVAEENMKKTALVGFRTGQKANFGEVLRQADEFACGLIALGVKKNGKIVVLSLNSFIDTIALLGANKIGVVIEFLDPDSDIAQMQRHASKADVLIVEGVFLPLAKKICNNVDVVVYNYTRPFISRDNYITYEEFIDKGRDIQVFINDDVSLPAVIIFSSGSTGAPKPIVHSNYSVNCAIKKMLHSDFPLHSESFMAKAIPSHIGLGVITSMLVALMAGMAQIIIGTIDESVFNFETDVPALIAMLTVSESIGMISNYKNWLSVNNFEENKGLVFFAAPIFFKIILSHSQSINDMSFIKGVLLGGSKMSKKELDDMEKVFKNKGLSVPIGIGYGQNELCGAVALNTVHHNKNGSAGYPVIGTNIRIVDRDTYQDVGYNQVGLILEQSDSMFLCYDKMPDETAKTKITLSDGTEWYNSNDLGYMDEDGFVFITGRINRVVIKSDHKVSMDVVEAKIKAIEGIQDAAVVTYTNGTEDGDTIVFAILESKKAEMSLDIINDPKHGLTVFETPVKLVIVDELPRMNNGKVDYQTLEKEAEKI